MTLIEQLEVLNVEVDRLCTETFPLRDLAYPYLAQVRISLNTIIKNAQQSLSSPEMVKKIEEAISNAGDFNEYDFWETDFEKAAKAALSTIMGGSTCIAGVESDKAVSDSGSLPPTSGTPTTIREPESTGEASRRTGVGCPNSTSEPVKVDEQSDELLHTIECVLFQHFSNCFAGTDFKDDPKKQKYIYAAKEVMKYVAKAHKRESATTPNQVKVSVDANEVLTKFISENTFTGNDFADYKAGFFDGFKQAKDSL